MTTLTRPLQAQPTQAGDWIYRLTIEQYHEAIRSGVFAPDDPVEFVDGLLLQKMAPNPPHSTCVRLLRESMAAVLPDNWFYDSELTVTLSDGEPEPDGAILRGRILDYAARHPAPDDAALVIEVADASLRRDRGIKLRSYARAGIACYWIVNLIDRCIEVYRNPQATAEPPAYGTQAIYREADELPVVIAGNTVGCIAVAAVLPPA